MAAEEIFPDGIFECVKTIVHEHGLLVRVNLTLHLQDVGPLINGLVDVISITLVRHRLLQSVTVGDGRGDIVVIKLQ